MPKPIPTSVEAIIRDAIAGVVERATVSIKKAIAAELKPAQGNGWASAARGTRRKGRRRVARKEMTKWVADNRARRVPNFVIQATGLDTKKKIVAKFGPNAAFAKGKQLPATKPVPAGSQAKPVAPVKAKAPVVRKAAVAK